MLWKATGSRRICQEHTSPFEAFMILGEDHEDTRETVWFMLRRGISVGFTEPQVSIFLGQ